MSLEIRKVDLNSWMSTHFLKEDHLYRGDLKRFNRFNDGFKVLRIFWANDILNSYFYKIYLNQRLIGVFRLVLMRKQFKHELKLDVQDFHLLHGYEHVIPDILDFIIDVANRENLEVTFSIWNSQLMNVLLNNGLKPYKRSVLIMWNINSQIPKEGNKEIKTIVNDPNCKSLARRIMRESWGFYIPPNLKYHDVIIGLLNGEPVASTYINKLTGNLDFGVHVIRRFWRRRIGTKILEEARKILLSKGFREMYVVRVINLYKTSEPDIRALSFYVNCGGKILRDIIGLKVGKWRGKYPTSINKFIRIGSKSSSEYKS